MSPKQPSVNPTLNAHEAIGVGALLKALREAKGVSLSDASARIKFSVRQLESLEAEQWDSLPDGLLLRGMVKNYARYLEADMDAVLLQLESQVSGVEAPRPVPKNLSSASTRGDTALYSERQSRSWGWWLIILLVLLVAGFYALDRGWIPESWLVFDWLKGL